MAQLRRAVAATVVLAAALGALGCSKSTRPDGGSGLLPAGSVAPDFEALDADGKAVRLSSGDGHARVVYFYPKDETPGCTKEACAFRDAWKKYAERGVLVYGVSRDSAASHREFQKAHELPFPLAADESGAVQAAYGVPSRLGMAARVTFLVDANGKVSHVFEDVDPGIHAGEVLAKVP